MPVGGARLQVVAPKIGVVGAATPLLAQAGIDADEGIADFIGAAKNGRVWEREPTLRTPA